MELEHALHDGSPRPSWAGPVRILSRARESTGGEGRGVQLSGLVLPVAMAHRPGSPGPAATFGAGLGFPNLRDHVRSASPDLWHHWHRFEHMVVEAAAATMGWQAQRSTRAAARSSLPEHALELHLHHAPPARRGSALEMVTGEVRKMFAIRSVTGDRVRFESASASTPFRITPSSASWSRDPRSL